MMAKSQYQIGKYENAKRVCKSILTNYSNSPYEVDVYILLGDIALTQEKISQAFKFFLHSSSINFFLLSSNSSIVEILLSINSSIYSCLIS